MILPLDAQHAIPVLQAAEQLGTDLKFSVSMGTFGQADVAALGDIAEQMYFNAELPPITASAKEFPILPEVIKDLSASGEKTLTKKNIKSSPFRSWVAVYHFVTIMEQYGDLDVISGNDTDAARANVIQAMNAADRCRHVWPHPAVDAQPGGHAPR